MFTVKVDAQRGARIFAKLTTMAPDLRTAPSYTRSCVAGSLDLHLLTLEESAGYRRISLAQYWALPAREMIPDPDMSIAVFFEWRVAEALTYQDAYSFDEAYYDPLEPPDLARHTKLNVFLDDWLDQLLKLGHSLRGDPQPNGRPA